MGRKRLFNEKEKWCNKCKKWLPLGAFGENKRTASGKSHYCKTCHNAYCGTFWTKVKVQDAYLLAQFNMQPGEYLNMWRTQNQQCPICERPLVLYNRKTVVDYRDGHVHGLICSDCQKGLQVFQDSKTLLRASIYLAPKVEAATVNPA